MQSPGLEYLMMLLVVSRIEDVSSDHEHTHSVLKNFQSWVSDKFSSESLEDPQATKSFLKIVFARLNTLRSEIPCGRHGGGADARSDNSNHLDRVEQAIVEQVCKHSDCKFKDILRSPEYLKMFCKLTLTSALFPEHICNANWTSSDEFDDVNILMTSVRRHYRRDAAFSNGHGGASSLNIVFETEAYANRFLCIRDRNVSEAINLNRGAHADLGNAAVFVVHKILEGFNFINNSDLCPMDFLHDSYSTLQRRSGLHDHISVIDRILHNAATLTKGDSQKRSSALRRAMFSMQQFPSTKSLLARDESISKYHPSMRILQAKKDIDGDRDHPSAHGPQWPSTGGSSNHGGTHSNQFLHDDGRPDRNDVGIRNCYNGRSLMDIYTGNHHNQHTDSVSMGLFLDMCPAILDQLIHGATDCWRLSTEPHLTTPAAIPTFSVSKTTISNETLSKNTSMKSKANSYIFGSLSTLVISLFSMFGAVFMKLTRVNIRAYLMAFMLSLAVGCLVADAGLHLLPEILAEEKEEETDGEHDELLASPLKKMCAFLASIYAFFILELMLSTKHEHSHSDQNGTVSEQQIVLKSVKPVNDINIKNLTVRNKLNNLERDDSQRSVTLHSPVLFAKQTNQTHQGQPQACGRTSSLDDPRCNSVSAANSNASDRISVHDTPSNIKALAWMIIIGDGIHNFADGLAIGAAYAVTFTKGLSISITVLCHEVPHELGDFAVLISTGMSIKKALVLNFLSSLTAFAGLYIGLALGAQEETSKWIFSVGAGMFLYVALTDLIPECKEIYKKTPTVKMFVTENLGLLFGFATMLLLAMYEDSMKIDI